MGARRFGIVGTLVVAALLTLSGCQAGDDAPVAEASKAPASDTRQYEVYVPASYDAATPAPLLVLLHGYGMTGDQLAEIYDVATLAEREGFLYVAPDGTPDQTGRQFWNATDGCCNSGDLPVDDSGYLASVIAETEERYAVDPARVVVLGVSNGGFMAYRLACDHADAVAAIASIAGATYLDSTACAPASPVTVLQVHGTADDLIPYEGGAFVDQPFPSASATASMWAAYNRCDPVLAETGSTLDLETSLPGAETSIASARGCPPSVAVELWSVGGGDHTMDFGPDAVPRMVDFLLAHPKAST